MNTSSKDLAQYALEPTVLRAVLLDEETGDLLGEEWLCPELVGLTDAEIDQVVAVLGVSHETL